MNQRLIAILAITAGLIGMLVIGVLIGIQWARPTPPPPPGSSDGLGLPIITNNNAPQPPDRPISLPPNASLEPDKLSFRTVAARDEKLKTLLSKSRLEVLAAFPEAVPQQSLAAGAHELNVEQLNEQIEKIDIDPNATVALDTIYTYAVESPEPGVITVTIRDGTVTEAIFHKSE